MRSKYVIFLAMILSVASINGSFQSVFAQEVVQSKETSGSNLEDLKWQLGVMEESAARQQEQIQAIKERLDVVAAEPAQVEKIYNKEELEHAVEDYLSTEEARKKLGLGLPGVAAMYTPDEENIQSYSGRLMTNTHWVLAAGCNSDIHSRIMMQIMDTETQTILTSAGQGFLLVETYMANFSIIISNWMGIALTLA